MIRLRTLLIYNFGIALIFVVIGLLSFMTLDPFTNRTTIQPPFDPASHVAMQEEQDVERLRSRAIFYFELGRELKRARYADTDSRLSEFRYLCFALATAFALGGAMSLAAARKGTP